MDGGLVGHAHTRQSGAVSIVKLKPFNTPLHVFFLLLCFCADCLRVRDSFTVITSGRDFQWMAFGLSLLWREEQWSLGE